MLLQQVVRVDVLRLPHTLHVLLVHLQAHGWHLVYSTAGGKGLSAPWNWSRIGAKLIFLLFVLCVGGGGHAVAFCGHRGAGSEQM